MSNFQAKKLGDLCHIEIGKTPYRGNKAFWDSEKTTENVWLSIADLLNTNNNAVFDSKEYISAKGASLCKKVKEGTLLVSFKLTLGRLVFAGLDLYTNEAIAALNIIDERVIDKNYLFYYLTFFDWHKAAEGSEKVKGKSLNKAKLREINIIFPDSLGEQKRIVRILDEVFENIEVAKKNTEKNLQYASELFDSYLQSVFANPGAEWSRKKLGDVCEELFAGGDVPKQNSSKVKTEGFAVPIFSNGEKNKGLYGYTNVVRVKKPSITISARGTIGYSEVREKPFYPAIRLIVATPNLSTVNIYFLQYLIQSMNFAHSGTSIPQLTVPMIKECSALIPPLKQQEAIVATLDSLATEKNKLKIIYKQKLADLEELKKSILQKAFNGGL